MTTVEGRQRSMRLRKEDLDTRFPGLLDSVLTGVRPGICPTRGGDQGFDLGVDDAALANS
jgi:hypothetical protein